MKRYRINLESLPDYWDDDDCHRFRTGLNASFALGSDAYHMLAADKSGGLVPQDESESDYNLDDNSESDEEEELIPNETEKTSKRDLVCRPLFRRCPRIAQRMAGSNYPGHSNEPDTARYGE